LKVYDGVRCKPDVETYNALMNVHGRAGQWTWATQIFEDMLRAAVSFNNCRRGCTLPLHPLFVYMWGIYTYSSDYAWWTGI
jgi:pentatricopeptide repeat protein